MIDMRYSEQYSENDLAAASDLMARAVNALRAPNRIKVSEYAQTVRIAADGGASTWDPTVTPYMIEPMDVLTSREHEMVVFIGPQRTGKTQALIDAWMAYSIECDPADFMAVFPTSDLARDFSIRRLARMIEYNPELKDHILSKQADTVFDKRFDTGSMITLSWPSVGQLRQRDIRFACVTELDSMPSDLSGAGDIAGLVQKRTQTYLSSGMTLIESAPSKPVNLTALDDHILGSNHDCYPAEGVSTLYAQGDQRRLYWSCLSCGEEFQASMSNLKWNEHTDPGEAAKTAHVPCPHCGHIHYPKDKNELNTNILLGKGGWRRGTSAEGTELKSKIVSFWMEGPAAAFQSWEDLVEREVRALKLYNETGDETLLKRTRNSDQGIQYVPPSYYEDRKTVALKDRAEEVVEKQVPDDVNFLITSVDVQKNRFVVQVIGYGRDRQAWLINRYNIVNSPTRVMEDGTPCTIAPFTYPEDWDVLDKVQEHEYSTAHGAKLKCVRLVYDTGGFDQATAQAYSYFKRWVKRARDKQVVQPIKGVGKQTVKMQLSDPVSKKEGIPLYTLNVDAYKDELSHALQRIVPGPGYIHFPAWLGDWFYKELQAETKNPRTGKWEKLKSTTKNEAWDLFVYSFSMYELVTKRLDWDKPLPAWAQRAGDRPVTRSESGTNVGRNLDWLKDLAKKNADRVAA